MWIKLILALIITILSIISLFLITVGYTRQEVKTCYKLQAQSLDYPGFYLTAWQSEMCNYYGIIINNQ